MAVRRFLARYIKVEVNTGTVATPTWTEVKGLINIDHSPSTERADTTGFDSAGRSEHLVAQRGDSFTLGGRKLIDPDTGAGDPGQEELEEAGRAFGSSAERQLRFTLKDEAGADIGGSDRYTFMITPEVTGPFGTGGTNDPAGWSAACEVTGAPTIDQVP
jgi:hypothetical protein